MVDEAYEAFAPHWANSLAVRMEVVQAWFGYLDEKEYPQARNADPREFYDNSFVDRLEKVGLFPKDWVGKIGTSRDSVAGKNRQRNFQCPRVFRAKKHAKGQKQLEHRRESHDLGPAGEKAIVTAASRGWSGGSFATNRRRCRARDLRSERRNFLGVRQGELLDGTSISVNGGATRSY